MRAIAAPDSVFLMLWVGRAVHRLLRVFGPPRRGECCEGPVRSWGPFRRNGVTESFLSGYRGTPLIAPTGRVKVQHGLHIRFDTELNVVGETASSGAQEPVEFVQRNHVL